MDKRYERITYSDHAEAQIAEREYLSKALVEQALNGGVIKAAKRGAFRAEYAIPGRDRLVLRVIFLEAVPKSAFVVTVYPLGKGSAT